MKCICTADLHGRFENIKKLRHEIEDADLVIIAGDITNFGDKDDAKGIIRAFMEYCDRILAIPGNCDKRDVNQALKDLKIYLHGKGIEINGVGFFGVGGSNITPFSTPQEYSDDELFGIASRGYGTLKSVHRRIMITHAPAYGILDRTSSGMHVGSKRLRDFIRENRVDLVISAHIHEARGMEHWQGTLFINPGPLHMGYAVVEIEEEIKAELRHI